MAALYVALLVIGCGARGESGTSPGDDQSEGAKAYSQGQSNPDLAASAPNKTPGKGEPQAIAGMNADAVLTTFLKPGLECWQQVARGSLYACSSEENHDLTLRYEGEISGRSAEQVSGIEASVFRHGTEDFDLGSQPFFGLLATQLDYRGADKKQAYEFVSRNLSGGTATITIGSARWTMETSEDSKVLKVAPASQRL